MIENMVLKVVGNKKNGRSGRSQMLRCDGDLFTI
jgi:hypothetical protein